MSTDTQSLSGQPTRPPPTPTSTPTSLPDLRNTKVSATSQDRTLASSSTPPTRAEPSSTSASAAASAAAPASTSGRFKYNPLEMLLPHERAQRTQALAAARPSGYGTSGSSSQSQRSRNFVGGAGGGTGGSTSSGSGSRPGFLTQGGSSAHRSQHTDNSPPSPTRTISPKQRISPQPSHAESSNRHAWATTTGRHTPSDDISSASSTLKAGGSSDVSGVGRTSRVVTNREPGTVDKDGNGDGNGVSVNGSARSKQHPQTAGGSADEICPLQEQPFQAALGGDGSAPNDEEELAAKGDDVDMDQELRAQQEVEVTVDGEKLPANLSDWELVETLGTGTFGRVVLARVRPPWRSTSYHPIFPHLTYSADPLEPTPQATASADANRPHFAMKILAKSEIVRLKQVEHINNELAILKKVRHPFLVELYAAYQDHLNVYMILSYHSGGELFSHLRRAGRFSTDVSRYYIATVALALAYLHRQGIVFRDIKPENILIGEDGYVRLCDFGFAKHVGHEATFTLCGTPDYLAPEIVLSKGHGLAVDLWSLGILTYELLVGYPPFFADNPMRTYERILESKVVFPAHVDHYARSFIRGLLQPDLSKRLGNLKGGTDDILSHPFFAGVDWDILEGRQITPPIIPARMSRGDCQNFQRYPPPAASEIPGVVGIPPGAGFRDPYTSLFTHFTFPSR